MKIAASIGKGTFGGMTKMSRLATTRTEATVAAWQALLFENVGRFNPEVAVALTAVILVLVHVSSVERSGVNPRAAVRGRPSGSTPG